MNKRFAAVLAATAIAGVTTAFAANPFSDVTPSDWAYQAVSTLASQGVINGYPDGTFKGQNNITRYEMAQMVAKAMARQDRVNAEQGAMINRLANEFAEELNNLGVRVTNLEKKVGNVKLTGDARLLYTETRGQDDDGYAYRVRLGVNAAVNDRTVVGARLVMENEFGDATPGRDNLKFDRAYVKHQFGSNLVATAGRQGMFVGQGLTYDETFDGVLATLKLGSRANLTAAYGYTSLEDPLYKPTSTLVQLSGKITDNVDAVVYNHKGHGPTEMDYYGAGLTAGFGKFTVDGEYAKSRHTEDGAAWTAGLTYGTFDEVQKGTWNVGVRYLRAEMNAPVQYTTFDNPLADQAIQGYKGWNLETNYALAKNLSLKAMYFFNQDGIKVGQHAVATDVDDAYRVELNYKF